MDYEKQIKINNELSLVTCLYTLSIYNVWYDMLYKLGWCFSGLYGVGRTVPNLPQIDDA